MRIDVLTLFPEVLQPYFTASILGRAQAAGLIELHAHQLRDYSTDSHHKVDDRPFGGGPGMVLMCQPIIDAVRAIEDLDPRPALRMLLTPQGRSFAQPLARELAQHERLLIICGHYEGYDERIIDLLQPLEISLGDFVLTGGEPAALAIVDAVVRLVPGVLGHEDGATSKLAPRKTAPAITARLKHGVGHKVKNVPVGGARICWITPPTLFVVPFHPPARAR